MARGLVASIVSYSLGQKLSIHSMYSQADCRWCHLDLSDVDLDQESQLLGVSDLGSTHFDSAASSLAEALNDTDDWVVNCKIQCIHSVAKPIGDVKTKVQTEVHMHLGSDF